MTLVPNTSYTLDISPLSSLQEPVEKFCPVCGRGYDNAITTCEDDGERLVIISEEPTMVGRELEGKYKVTDVLGEGGMGSVYLAYQSTMDREVAVKVLKREYCQNKLAIKRFLREARAASKLAHPNTITVYDFGQTADGLLYMVMEKLTGKPLADLMDEEGAFNYERAGHILSQICDSLAEAHANGITHRDLKPENIFIEPKYGNPEHVKVLDFGIAKMNEDGNSNATATGMICGTPSYMSPEQAMGKNIDGRSDIYALGILLFEMLAAERPFDGDTAMEVMLKHLNETPPELPPEVVEATPPALVDLMHVMLAKRIDDRPVDCMTLKAALQDALGTSRAQHVSTLAGPKRQRQATKDAVTSFDKGGLTDETDAVDTPKKRSGLVWAAAAIILALGGVGAYYGLAGDSDVNAEPVAAASDQKGDGKEGSNDGKDDSSDPKANGLRAGVVHKDDPTTTTADGESPKTAKASDSLNPDKPVSPADAGANPTAETVAVVTPAPVGQVAGSALGAISGLSAARQKNPPVDMVSLTVRSDPPSCIVWDGEEVVGQTPLTIKKPKNSGVVRLKVTKDGFKAAELVMGTVQSYVGTAKLESLTAVAPKPTPATTKKKKKKRKKKDAGGIGTF